jgi:NAD(P)-dependent dehydrogenase (short-subunit alcohol dehydrogenase family)
MDADRGRMLAGELTVRGAPALFVEAHTERGDEAAGFVRRAREAFGRLDVLVNSAGMRLYQTVVDACGPGAPSARHDRKVCATRASNSWISAARPPRAASCFTR